MKAPCKHLRWALYAGVAPRRARVCLRKPSRFLSGCDLDATRDRLITDSATSSVERPLRWRYELQWVFPVEVGGGEHGVVLLLDKLRPDGRNASADNAVSAPCTSGARIVVAWVSTAQTGLFPVCDQRQLPEILLAARWR